MMGVILCGGQSTRMGADKGLMLHQSVTWTEHTAKKLMEAKLPIILSINAQQDQSYSTLFNTRIRIKDREEIMVGGPLKGILSVHLQTPKTDLLVLACDMQNMKTEILNYLLSAYTTQSYEAVVFGREKATEPLCAIYTARGLAKIYRYYLAGELKKFSLQYILQLLKTLYLPINKGWENSFCNFNTPEDLSDL